MEHDQRESLWLLADRASLALEDRRMQQRVFRSLQDLQPQVDMIQRMRAAGRYDSRASLLRRDLPPEADLANWVKDALTHYWGGPKLTNSPLMRLQVVQNMADEYDGNAANALRALLAQGGGPSETRRRPPIHHGMDSLQHPGNEIHGGTKGTRGGWQAGHVGGGSIS